MTPEPRLFQPDPPTRAEADEITDGIEKANAPKLDTEHDAKFYAKLYRADLRTALVAATNAQLRAYVVHLALWGPDCHHWHSSRAAAELAGGIHRGNLRRHTAALAELGLLRTVPRPGEHTYVCRPHCTCFPEQPDLWDQRGDDAGSRGDDAGSRGDDAGSRGDDAGSRGDDAGHQEMYMETALEGDARAGALARGDEQPAAQPPPQEDSPKKRRPDGTCTSCGNPTAAGPSGMPYELCWPCQNGYEPGCGECGRGPSDHDRLCSRNPDPAMRCACCDEQSSILIGDRDLCSTCYSDSQQAQLRNLLNTT